MSTGRAVVPTRNFLSPPADTSAVGIQNALKFGAGGFAADLLLYGLPNGLGLIGGALVGLCVPDGKSLNQVYDPTANLGPSRHEGGSLGLFQGAGGGLGMFEGLFGNSEGRPEDPSATPQRFDAKTMLAAGLGALLFTKVGGFSLPLYGAYLAGMMPYNEGGLQPLMWSSGVIPPSLGGLWGGWGATAGWLT